MMMYGSAVVVHFNTKGALGSRQASEQKLEHFCDVIYVDTRFVNGLLLLDSLLM